MWLPAKRTPEKTSDLHFLILQTGVLKQTVGWGKVTVSETRKLLDSFKGISKYVYKENYHVCNVYNVFSAVRSLF